MIQNGAGIDRELVDGVMDAFKILFFQAGGQYRGTQETTEGGGDFSLIVWLIAQSTGPHSGSTYLLPVKFHHHSIEAVSLSRPSCTQCDLAHGWTPKCRGKSIRYPSLPRWG